MRFLSAVVISAFIVLTCACAKKDITYKITKKDGVSYIKTTFNGKATRTLKELKTVRFTDEFVNWYMHATDKKDHVAAVIQKKNLSYLTMWDKDLNRIGEYEIKTGKGPGELSGWIPGIGMNENSLFFLDSNKTSIEEFDHDMRFKESYTFYDVRFRFNYGNTKVHLRNGFFYISPVKNFVAVKTDMNGMMINSIPQEDPDGINGFLKNLNEHAADANGNLYLIMIGYENKYEVRKYDRDLKLVWINSIDDGLLNTLSSTIVEFPNGSFELNGGKVATGIDCDEDHIYIIRGVNGIATWKWENETKVLTQNPVPGLKNGFVDVFNAHTGLFEYRIDAPFVNTSLRYKINIIGTDFYFASPFSRDNDKNPITDSNVLIHAVIDPALTIDRS